MNFESFEILNQSGGTIIKLYCEQAGYLEEFGLDFNWKNKSITSSIKDTAIDFVKKSIPNMKTATIVIVAGAVILASFPFQTAKAHNASFNMTYLFFGNTKSYISQIDQTQGNLNVVSPSYFDINKDGSLKISKQFDPLFISEMKKRGIKVVPFLSNHWDREVGRSALENREVLSTQIAAFIIQNDLHGVQVDIENVTQLDRDNYTDLIRLLKEKLPAGKEVSVAVAANPGNWKIGWHGSYDYPELAKYADYLMIMAYDESYPGSAAGPVASYPWVEKSIQYAINQKVPPEKIVLGVPFYGRYWKKGATSGGGGISNYRVDEMLKKYGGTVTFDEASKSPKAIITIDPEDDPFYIAGNRLEPGEYTVWFENHDSIKAKLSLIHKYNIKGTGSWSLGQESPTIWKDYKAWISHDGVISESPVGTGANPVVNPNETSMNTQQPVQAPKPVAPAPSQPVMPVPAKPVAPTQPKPIVSAPTKPVAPIPANPVVSAPAKPVQPSIVGTTLVPKATNTYMRSSANSTAKTVKTLTVRDTVKVLQEFTDSAKVKWLKVQSGATTGWVQATQLIPKPIVTSTVKSYPTLKYGSKGAPVVQLQDKLRKANIYKGKSHGTFDSATKAAVITFQKKYKLKADGIVGTVTHSKLDSSLGIK